MKNFLFLLSMLLPMATFSVNDFFSDANVFFKTYVDGKGRVDYAAMKAAPIGLNYIVSNVALFSLKDKDEATQKAYWINTYNILMIKSIVDHYPVAKVSEIKDVFQLEIFNAAGKRVSLDMIENNILRKQFADPRLHFVLVCAAVSCPSLADFAFFPNQLDKQLDARTRQSLNHPGFIKTNPGKKQVLVSEIFKWYKVDFDVAAPSLIEFVNRYRTEPIPAKYSVDYYSYDWSLNEKKSGTGSVTHPVFKEGNAPDDEQQFQPNTISEIKSHRFSVGKVSE